MSVLFVTVGTSALTNERIGLVDQRDNSALVKAVRDYREDQTKRKGEIGPYQHLFMELLEAHAAAWRKSNDFFLRKDGLPNSRNYRATSAELLSTFLLARLATQIPPIEKLVLFASDTAEGMFAAELNRQVFQTPQYWEKVGVRDYQVYVERVDGLDDRIGSPGHVVQALIDKHCATGKVRINVTGGYKGFAALLGYLAAKRQYHLFYLHEALLRPAFLKNGDVTEVPGGDW